METPVEVNGELERALIQKRLDRARAEVDRGDTYRISEVEDLEFRLAALPRNVAVQRQTNAVAALHIDDIRSLIAHRAAVELHWAKALDEQSRQTAALLAIADAIRGAK